MPVEGYFKKQWSKVSQVWWEKHCTDQRNEIHFNHKKHKERHTMSYLQQTSWDQWQREMLTVVVEERHSEDGSLRAGISGEARIQKTVGPFHILRDSTASNCTHSQSKHQSRGEISLSDTWDLQGFVNRRPSSQKMLEQVLQADDNRGPTGIWGHLEKWRALEMRNIKLILKSLLT